RVRWPHRNRSEHKMQLVRPAIPIDLGPSPSSAGIDDSARSLAHGSRSNRGQCFDLEMDANRLDRDAFWSDLAFAPEAWTARTRTAFVDTAGLGADHLCSSNANHPALLRETSP